MSRYWYQQLRSCDRGPPTLTCASEKTRRSSHFRFELSLLSASALTTYTPSSVEVLPGIFSRVGNRSKDDDLSKDSDSSFMLIARFAKGQNVRIVDHEWCFIASLCISTSLISRPPGALAQRDMTRLPLDGLGTGDIVRRYNHQR